MPTNCPYCDSAYIEELVKSKDFFLTNEEFSVMRCLACKIQFTYPQPLEPLNYYKSKNYASHSAKSKSAIESLYRLVRVHTTKWKTGIIKKIKDDAVILDFGCGTGEFLYQCKSHGWKFNGLEPVDSARKIAEKKLQISLFQNPIELKPEVYDIITLWHVLEHVSQLNNTLKTLTKSLSKEGRLLLAVPNPNSYDAKYYGKYWAAYDLPRHLWHFTAESMEKVTWDAGLTIERIIPMKLDSYYISLLSTKYRKPNPINIIGSIFIALKSNHLAKKTTNYSSLIYVTKKI